MSKTIKYKAYETSDIDAVIALGNHVHGDNYLDVAKATYLQACGIKNGINAGLVAYDQERLVGFRLTQAAEQWDIDEWCSPDLWQHPANAVCYFKCNTVDETYRGYGIGSTLLKKSIEQAKEQGANAGLAHIWLASPGNSAFKYFSKCGGQLVKEHPNRWQPLSISDGYVCPVCDGLCTCTAAEMIIHFD